MLFYVLHFLLEFTKKLVILFWFFVYTCFSLLCSRAVLEKKNYSDLILIKNVRIGSQV